MGTALIALPGLSAFGELLVSNLVQLLAASLAAVVCLLVARDPLSGSRTAWWGLGAGVASWAAGQLVWTWYEVVDGTEVPFPSLADVGFLLFPLGAAVGLVAWLGGQANVVARGRDLLDGVIIAVSLLVLSWVTVLDQVIEDNSDGAVALALSLAYPLGDVVLGTLALLALARARSGERAVLATLAGGLACLAFADSAYLYLVSAGRYTSADLVSAGWAFGFLLVAAAALVDLTDPGRRTFPRPPQVVVDNRLGLLGLTLPYLPFSAAGVAVLWSIITDPESAVVSSILSVVLVVMVLARQFLAMVENQRLYVALGAARDQLQHRALHDDLTGLANRALFNDRLDHALRRSGSDLGLLFCDLDDFKRVNDRLGHVAGDEVLVEVARRLRGCVRSGDTVARLGGDEFAILLDDAAQTQQVADRVITAMLEPFTVGGTTVGLSMSVGITRHSALAGGRRSADRSAGAPSAPGVTPTPASLADRMLREADLAMYAAKTSGKGRAVTAGDHDAADPASGGGVV
ncbi:MAG TPA: GGDEF domain-containing protein [Nocardioides sp.]|nr:GGDEF domain-containing protein [Nocardioides sp.]